MLLFAYAQVQLRIDRSVVIDFHRMQARRGENRMADSLRSPTLENNCYAER
ncbi:hypothetical protein N182_28400 [Sinorhizobium sp. GL2]|nr:hypothetical protein N182_28400 [Sinorhizobium sp. GL2]